jgi:hypothetical protein
MILTEFNKGGSVERHLLATVSPLPLVISPTNNKQSHRESQRERDEGIWKSDISPLHEMQTCRNLACDMTWFKYQGKKMLILGICLKNNSRNKNIFGLSK